MKRIRAKCMPLTLVILAFFIFGSAGPGYALPLRWDLDMIHRNDSFRWSIAGDSNGANPNVLSELTWTDIETWPMAASLGIGLGPRLELQARGLFAMIGRGYVQDSDYDGDDRTLEFSRSNNQTAGDVLYDLSGAVVYHFVANSRWSVAAKLGYSREAQHFRMVNGFQTIPADGSFAGLNSTYQASWNGPFLGLNSLYRGGWVDLTGDIEYHWAAYYGEGDWNLRDNLAHPVSFIHQASGNGWRIDLGMAVKLTDHWRIRFNMQTGDWNAGPGLDQVLASDGSTIETQLNEVAWNNLTMACRAEWR